ncbi:class F sortase [Actinomadura harenae]|uniref:class F sortase n=1 Tax=Actinomadura harenae TaxID=2483351 RepID=UPI001F23A3B8|nr:class F sortase [Actinomadura harenae]
MAALLVGGCGSGGPYADGPSDPGGTRATGTAGPVRYATSALPRSEPSTIRIPRLRVTAPVTGLGLRPDGTIEVPPLDRPNLAGWWKDGATPGEKGPSVILGHVDARGQAAVFNRLKDLRKGDRVLVARKDGRTATFAVQRVERVAKADFPGERIYAEDLDYAALRLVTCGGAFDRGTGHYVDNVIAYTRLVRD